MSINGVCLCACVSLGGRGRRRAVLHAPPGGEEQPREPQLGHKEDLPAGHIFPQQMAG